MVPSSHSQGRRLYQYKPTNLVVVAICLVAATFFVSTANDSPAGPDTGSYSEPSGVVALSIAVLWLALAVRGWRAGLLTTDAQVVIRNTFSTRSVGWEEIDNFEVVGQRGVPDSLVLGVRLRSGRLIRVSALAGENPSGLGRRRRQALDQYVAELNEELASPRSGEHGIGEQELTARDLQQASGTDRDPRNEGRRSRLITRALQVLYLVLVTGLVASDWLVDGDAPWHGLNPLFLVLYLSAFLAVRLATRRT